MTQDSENDGNDARSPSKPLQYQKITQKKDINITNEYGTKKTSRHCSLFTFNILSRIILLIQDILNKYIYAYANCKNLPWFSSGSRKNLKQHKISNHDYPVINDYAELGCINTKLNI